VKLVVDVDLNSQLFSFPFAKENTILEILNKAKITQRSLPLEAFLCEKFAIEVENDLPIAAICANVDGISVGQSYWFRADPAFLVMQRDTFTLGEQLPLTLNSIETNQLVDSLNQHFNQDGLHFHVGVSGAWYLELVGELNRFLPVSTTLPSVAVGKNMNYFLPTGDKANCWISLQNEIQMLLHEHPVNQIRESKGDQIVNSLWISGGGYYPISELYQAPRNGIVIANSCLYEGIAKYANMNFAKLDTLGLASSFSGLIKAANQDVLVYLPQDAYLDNWFFSFVDLLRTRKISQLEVNFGWYEQIITATIKPYQLNMFWKKSKTLQHFFK